MNITVILSPFFTKFPADDFWVIEEISYTASRWPLSRLNDAVASTTPEDVVLANAFPLYTFTSWYASGIPRYQGPEVDTGFVAV
mgnify:CR=1 FL=1